MEDERTLLEKLARGDRASFDALYMRYAAKTEEFLCRMLKNRAEAEDITHDLFLKIWQNRSTMAGVTAFGSYLFRMARNAVYDRFDSRTVRTNFARRPICCPNTTSGRGQPRPAAADSAGGGEDARAAAAHLPHEP